MSSAVDFSVVIPTFRRPTQLRDAIISVLEQSGVQVEVLVVDDSPERSAEPVIADLNDARIVYIANPKPSCGFPSKVRNLGWPHAKGRFVHFLDDDDIVPQEHYFAVQAAFSACPSIGVIFSVIRPFGDCGAEQLEHERKYFEQARRLAEFCSHYRSRLPFVACLMFHWAILVCGAGIIRRECVALIGGFDPEIRLREDVDFYARAMRRFGVYFLDQVGLQYRIGSPSLMHAPELSEREVRDLNEARLRTNAKYQREWGGFEFYALKIFARAILKLVRA